MLLVLKLCPEDVVILLPLWINLTMGLLLLNSSQKSPFFARLDECSVRPAQIFRVQAKMSTVPPVFPDYISISYDYELRQLQSVNSR